MRTVRKYSGFISSEIWLVSVWWWFDLFFFPFTDSSYIYFIKWSDLMIWNWFRRRKKYRTRWSQLFFFFFLQSILLILEMMQNKALNKEYFFWYENELRELVDIRSLILRPRIIMDIFNRLLFKYWKIIINNSWIVIHSAYVKIV